MKKGPHFPSQFASLFDISQNISTANSGAVILNASGKDSPLLSVSQAGNEVSHLCGCVFWGIGIESCRAHRIILY